MLPSKIFFGTDGSKTPNFKIEDEYFIVAGISCTDLGLAYKIEKETVAKYGDKKGIDIYLANDWENLLKMLAQNDFRFHILYLDKKTTPPQFSLPLQKKKYALADSPADYQSKATIKINSMHTWLVVNMWAKSGFTGDAELRADKDFHGPAWVQHHKEITNHAKNCGFKSCDYKQVGIGQYPLVRFADYIAPIFRFEFKNQGNSIVFDLVKDKAIFYPLIVAPSQNNASIQTLPPLLGSFKPW